MCVCVCPCVCAYHPFYRWILQSASSEWVYGVCVCVCVWVGGWVGVGVCDYAGSRCLEEEKNLSLANSIEERLPGYQTELAVISEEERV